MLSHAAKRMAACGATPTLVSQSKSCLTSAASNPSRAAALFSACAAARPSSALSARAFPLLSSANHRPHAATCLCCASRWATGNQATRTFTQQARLLTNAEAAASPAQEAAAKPEPAAAPDPAAELGKELEKKEASLKELNDKYRYALAEVQNTMTRGQQQLAEAKKFAIQGFAKNLLEVADILEAAVKAAESSSSQSSPDPHFKNLFEGVSLTQKVLTQIFERNGIKKFVPMGEKFDPYFQEGLLQFDDPTKTPGTVGLVLKPGYKLHERCLRAAQVGTVKAPPAAAASTAEPAK